MAAGCDAFRASSPEEQAAYMRAASSVVVGANGRALPGARVEAAKAAGAPRPAARGAAAAAGAAAGGA